MPDYEHLNLLEFTPNVRTVGSLIVV